LKQYHITGADFWGSLACSSGKLAPNPNRRFVFEETQLAFHPRERMKRFPSPRTCRWSRKNLYFDRPQFADVKRREQSLPRTAVGEFRSDAGVAKDRPSIARADRDGALVSLKEMQIASVESKDDAGEVACRKIDGLSVRRPPS
jgi:hypothetical protein